ncbi:MAG: hypothetical protein ACXW4M_09455, partial [Anaerolineales bacterium]
IVSDDNHVCLPNEIGQIVVQGLTVIPGYLDDTDASGFKAGMFRTGDLGYLAVYAMHALATGEITAEAGQSFEAGRLGEYTIEDDPDLGLNVLLGDPFVYNEENIDDFNW